MPVLEPVSDEQASPETKALFDKIQANFKMVPNIFRTMGYAHEVLGATMGFSASFQKGLAGNLQELAYLKTSMINECHY